MRKGLLIVLVVLASFAFCANSYAENLYQMMGISLRGGVGIPSEGGTDAGFAGQLGVSYGFNRYINGELEFGMMINKWKEYGDMYLFPIMANIQLRAADFHENFVPYLVGGVGGAILTIDEKSGYTSDVTYGFALKGGLGFDYYITENWVLNMEGDYYFTTAKAEVNKDGAAYAKHDNHSVWFIGAGLKYYFNP